MFTNHQENKPFCTTL